MKQIPKPSPLQGTNGQLMVMAAHRYCLGRRSYIVDSAIEWLTKHRSEFTEETRAIMVRDTVLALMDNEAGSVYDTMAWTEFASLLFNELPDDKKAWVRDATGYKKKEWPL